MLKTLLRNIVHFPTLRMGFYFLVEKGIFLLFRGKIKRIRSPSLFASEKDEFTFLADPWFLEKRPLNLKIG